MKSVLNIQVIVALQSLVPTDDIKLLGVCNTILSAYTLYR